MKIKPKTHFTFLAFILAISFSLQAFGQPPKVRKEAGDGGNGHKCDVLNSGIDQNLCYYINIYDSTFLNTCELYSGYQYLNSPMNYIEVGEFYYSDSLEAYFSKICFNISANEIAKRCENGYHYFA